MNRKRMKIIGGILIIVLAVFLLTNPARAAFNHTVFEGGTPNPITGDQEKMEKIIEVNRATYQNENDFRVNRKNYFLFSVYEVKAGDTQSFQILGVLGTFRLIKG